MPLYEYYCADCRTKFEALRPMNKADAPIQCKNCESTQTARTLSLFAAHTNGERSASSMAESGNFGGGCGCGSGACGCGHH
ncbi:MAG: zinc ribbon domain-containing protein [Chloroflexota bacterium]